jgi:hypothetical protein
LLTTLDRVNGRYGRGTILLASAGLQGSARTWWSMSTILTAAKVIVVNHMDHEAGAHDATVHAIVIWTCRKAAE